MKARGEVNGETDRDLLEAYVSHRERAEAAFAEIVRRHAPMVRATCRRVLGDAVASEDCTQVVFLLLAHKARRLKGQALLAGWLHRTAELTARNARRAVQRRARAERRACVERRTAAQPAPAAESRWADAQPSLDAALCALPAAQREVVVARYLCGQTEAQVCEAMGLPRSTVSVRLTRAMAALRKRLAGDGAALSPVAVGALLDDCRAAAQEPVSENVVSVALGQVEPSARALEFLKGAQQAMLRTQIQSAVAYAVAVVVLAAAPWAAYRGYAAETPAPREGTAPREAPAPRAPEKKIKAEWDGRVLVQLAGEAEAPRFSPDGTAVAYRYVHKRQAAHFAPGAVVRPRPAEASGVGWIDLATGTDSRLTLAENDLPPGAVLWRKDSQAVLVCAGAVLYDVTRAEGKLAKRELGKVAGGHRIEQAFLSPDGKWVLCECPLPAADGQRPDHVYTLFDLEGKAAGTFQGRKPLWTADSKTIYFNHNDALCSFAASGGAWKEKKEFTAAYYFTHPFPAERKPEDGYRFEVWPVAEGSEKAVVVQVVEIKVQAPFTPYSWDSRNRLVYWRANGANVNGKTTDLFRTVAGSPEVRWANIAAMAEPDVLLRCENLSLGGNPAVRAYSVLALKADTGVVLRQYAFPQSDRREYEYLDHKDKQMKKKVNHDPIYYEFHSIDAAGDVALFSFRIFRSRSKEDKQTGMGFTLLDLEKGDLRSVDLPNEFPQGGLSSIHSADLQPSAGRVVFEAREFSGTSGSVWLTDLNAKPAPGK